MKLKQEILSKGFALITVLWITAFLAVIASAVSYQSRGSIKLAGNVVSSLQTRHAAEGALLLTIEKIIKDGSAQGQLLPNNEYIYELGEVNIVVRVADESGKVDINLAPVDLLNSLFINLGISPELSLSVANRIVDWRDEDSLKRLNGAEDEDYYSHNLDYQAKDDEFDSIEEVSLVLGINQQLYNKIKPYLTVYAQDLGVNILLAPQVVKNAVQDIHSGGSAQQDLADYVTSTGGLIYTLHAKARALNGITTNITTIVRLQRGNQFEPFTVLGWKQE